MVSFDTSQTLLFNIGIDIFAICIILFLIVVWKWETMESYDNRILFRMQLMILVTLIADMFMWSFNGISGPFWGIIGYVDNVIYYLFQLLVLLEWLRYAYSRIYEKHLPRKAEFFAIVIPLSIIGFCVITSPLTGWCFYLDEGNFYHRGILSPLISIVFFTYLIGTSIAALLRRKRETLFERKRECAIIGFFVILPLLGGILQTIFYGCSLIWPCVTLSSLLLFINMENQAISQDALTRLNNRGNLDRYLHTSLENGQKVALMMLDINNFKHFNDSYGHEAGDMALIQTADILKNTFKESTAFLSRYGGDEFVIVLVGQEERDVKNILEKLQKSIDVLNQTNLLPSALSVSIGLATSTISDDSDVNRLLKEADEQMYREKKTFHKAHRTV